MFDAASETLQSKASQASRIDSIGMVDRNALFNRIKIVVLKKAFSKGFPIKRSFLVQW